MLEFYKTMGGRKFCDITLPELTRQMKRLADEMHTANLLKAKELASKETTPGDVAREFINEDIPEKRFTVKIAGILDKVFVSKMLDAIDAEEGGIIVRGSDYGKIRESGVAGLLLGAGIKIDIDEENNEATLTRAGG